jgi:hypothetical protein
MANQGMITHLHTNQRFGPAMASANRNGYDFPMRGGIRQNDVQMFLCIIFVCNHKCVAELHLSGYVPQNRLGEVCSLNLLCDRFDVLARDVLSLENFPY